MDDDTIHIDAQFVDSKTNDFQIDQDKLRQLAQKCLNLLGLAEFDLSILITDSEEIRCLNKQYRNQDKSTDVLSFPQLEWQSPLDVSEPDKNRQATTNIPAFQRNLGDVVVSAPDAARNADSIGHGLDRECCFLMVHGILHLCGHDHFEPEEEKIMLKNQQYIMKLLEMPHEPNWKGCLIHV